MRSKLLSTAVLVAVLSLACGGGVSSTPFSETARGRALEERSMTQARARAVLRELPSEKRQRIEQWVFLADLAMAAGNEDKPLRLYRQVESVLGTEPLVVSREQVATVLGDMKRVLDVHPEVYEEAVIADGYGVVTTMMTSAQGAFPTSETCLERLTDLPAEVAVAALVHTYYRDDLRQQYWMRQAIFSLVRTEDYGLLPLAIYADQLSNAYLSSDANSEYASVVRLTRPLLGEDFEPWYEETRQSDLFMEQLQMTFDIF